MSALFPGENTGTAATGTAPDDSATQTQEVDLSEVQEVENPEADYNLIPPPPPAGKYPLKITLGKDGITGRKSEKVGTFLVIPLELAVQAQGQTFDGYVVKKWINNIYSKLKGTTEAHWLLGCLGETVPTKISHADLKATLERVLAQNPIVMGELEWEASYKDPNNKRANDQGYVTAANKMIQFTDKNPDGSRSNFFKSPLDGAPLPARGYIDKFVKK